jgi:very-short-patch-repair endonuclease
MAARYFDDSFPPLFDPDALPRVIGRDEAVRRGFSRHAIDHRSSTGEWRRILPRTYLTADTLTDHDRCVAALIFAGSGAALSAGAALRMSGVRRVAMPGTVLVLVPPSNRVHSVRWVHVRRTFRAIEPLLAPGPRRVEVARAAADACLEMTRLDDVRTLVARVVQDRHCTIDELGAELADGPRRGSAHLRQALEEVGWGVASAPEAEAARILRRGGITDFKPNQTLTLPDGSTRVVDFYWARIRACLEIDSVEWHFDTDSWTATMNRDVHLSKAGYSVIHRPPSALRDPEKFVADVRDWLAGREADLRRGLDG